MQFVFETYLERLSESVDDVDLKDAMASAAGALELPMFAYLSLPPKTLGKPLLISNYPSDWTSYYLCRGYDEIDPVILRAQCGRCSFRWRWGCCRDNITQAQQGIFHEAAEFGIASGLTIPIHDLRGGFAALTFAAGDRNPVFMRVAEKYEHALQLMATCFHMEARRLTVDNRTIDGVRLTPREYQCLQWAARGKSARDIGAILDITQRTATFHRKRRRGTIAGESTTTAALASDGRFVSR